MKKYEKEKDFSKWYNSVVINSGLADFSFVKGFMFIKPYGYEIWENIQKILDKRLKETGHKNAYAPALIPEHLIKKEKEHIEGFAPECFWVLKSGENNLSEHLALRPTSETIIYSSYAKWIRSWRDLPLLFNFWNSVFRAEIKMTKLFIRTCEFLWQEGHTAHADENDAKKEIELILSIYKELIEEYLAIPVFVGKKSDKEKFPGAKETYTLEALMPDKKALQMGTVHNLGQNFSKVFEIKFLDKDEKKKYVWQTCWGVSTRLIGALVMVHGDDKGLILPPKISPIQIVIVPIFFKGQEDIILEKCRKVKSILEKEFKVFLDERKEYTPGWKFNEWELKGVPLRIEIGPEDIKNKRIIFCRRDSGERIEVEERNILKKAREILLKIQDDMFRKAKEFLEKNVISVNNLSEFKKNLGKGFLRACWCSSGECEEKIKEETEATIRFIPIKEEEIFSKCIYCGKDAKTVAYFAKAY